MESLFYLWVMNETNTPIMITLKNLRERGTLTFASPFTEIQITLIASGGQEQFHIWNDGEIIHAFTSLTTFGQT